MQGLTYVGFHYGWNKKLQRLDGLEAYLLRGSKYFSMEWDRMMGDFRKLHWVTYCKKFKPLLIDVGKWHEKPVPSPTTDNKWGCTLRCLQMLVANSLADYEDVGQLFDNDLRGDEAPFGIQNIAEVGLKEFGVFPGQWYGINCMSLVMESLVRKYDPIPNFNICCFQDGNINFDKIALAGAEEPPTMDMSFSMIGQSVAPN